MQMNFLIRVELVGACQTFYQREANIITDYIEFLMFIKCEAASIYMTRSKLQERCIFSKLLFKNYVISLTPFCFEVVLRQQCAPYKIPSLCQSLSVTAVF